MWWWIWTGLVLAAMAYFAFVGVWLWRRGVHLMHVADKSLSVFDRLVEADTTSGTQPRPVTALGDLEAARQYREERRVAKLRRRDARYARYRIRWQQWSTFND